MSNTPTYDQLSALCAQLAAALNAWMVFSNADDPAYKARWEVRGRVDTIAALTAYATMSPDPQWQRVPEGWRDEEKRAEAAEAEVKRLRDVLAGIRDYDDPNLPASNKFQAIRNIAFRALAPQESRHD